MVPVVVVVVVAAPEGLDVTVEVALEGVLLAEAPAAGLDPDEAWTSSICELFVVVVEVVLVLPLPLFVGSLGEDSGAAAATVCDALLLALGAGELTCAGAPAAAKSSAANPQTRRLKRVAIELIGS